jgi:hypothetical protein
MGATAVVQLVGTHLELVRHPADGLVVAFDDPDDAFAFAVSVELAHGASAGTVAAPSGEPVHVLGGGVSAFDLLQPMERAA